MSKIFLRDGLAVLMVGFAVLITAGCRQNPKLTREQALVFLQSELDRQPPVSAIIVINDAGMREGVTARYWDRSKAYSNRYWADFKLTPMGKKMVRLPDGGDTIAWHPNSPSDTRYRITLSPVVANHLKATDVSEPQKSIDGTVSVVFSEVTSLDGVPAPVQAMARESHTRLTTPHTATFVLENGAWKLQSID